MVKTISGRVSLALALSLLALAIVVGLSFSAQFSQYAMNTGRQTLENQAQVILSLLNAGTGNSQGGQGRGMTGAMGQSMRYRQYLRALNTQAGIDAWVVDKQGVVTTGYAQENTALPTEAAELVQAVLGGETRFGENFSSQQGVPTLTLGVPVMQETQVGSALLLHMPLGALQEARQGGLRILLISVFIGLLCAFAVSALLIHQLTKPLKTIQRTALKLAEGDYSAKTGITQTDEIGELASALDLLSLKLAQAKQQSDSADAMRQDFMANVSHELKTPVSVLRATLEALQDGLVAAQDIPATYALMQRETLALDTLIRDQMELSRLQTPEFSLNKEELDLRQTLQDAQRSARVMSQKRNVRIDLELPKDPYLFQGDAGRLRQMVLIALDNAIRFSPENGTVTLSLLDDRIQVSDEGPGFPEGSFERVFERFYRAPGDRNGEGYGLGLTIAREIALRHDIAAFASNKAGSGAQLTFLLPKT